jgi:membrane-bound serine protease (ClpP class)
VLIAIILLVVGMGLALLEVLIPSGGILGLLATAALVGALVLSFMEGMASGFAVLTAMGILLPVVVVLGFKWLPKSPFGKRLILQTRKETPEEFGVAGVCEEDFSSLVGKTGQTDSILRPSGFAMIDNERYTVVSDGEMVDEGVEIQVICVEGNGIVVEAVDERA